MPTPHNATPELRQRALELRQRPTPSEAALWEHLAARQLQGLKFRRQHVALGYIMDFYCAEYRIAVELDGSGHDLPNDLRRDQLFAAWGVMVLRFPNTKPVDEILTTLHACVRGRMIETIQKAARATADLKAMDRSANWYAQRRTLLQQQKIALHQKQMELPMPSSVKKDVEIITEAASLTVAKGLHVVERKA
jgi:very-short-patch-repair endonuclease